MIVRSQSGVPMWLFAHDIAIGNTSTFLLKWCNINSRTKIVVSKAFIFLCSTQSLMMANATSETTLEMLYKSRFLCNMTIAGKTYQVHGQDTANRK